MGCPPTMRLSAWFAGSVPERPQQEYAVPELGAPGSPAKRAYSQKNGKPKAAVLSPPPVTVSVGGLL
jgi:hypothetical protein